MLLAIMCSLLCLTGCFSPNQSSTTVEKNEKETKSEPVQNLDEAKAAYIKYLKEHNYSEGQDARYNLIYIDDNDIPEIYVTGPSLADPNLTLLTCYNNTVTGLNVYGGNLANYSTIYYQERKGKFCTHGGRSGYNAHNIYTLEKGNINLEHEGDYLEINGKAVKDSYWKYDGENVSMSEYHQKVESDFDFTQSKYPYSKAWNDSTGAAGEKAVYYTFSELIDYLSK